jgi:hypothetical protein
MAFLPLRFLTTTPLSRSRIPTKDAISLSGLWFVLTEDRDDAVEEDLPALEFLERQDE